MTAVVRRLTARLTENAGVDANGVRDAEGVATRMLRAARRSLDPDEIDQARESLALLLEMPGVTDSDRARILNNLASAHHLAFNKLGGIEALDRAITARERALVLTSPDDPKRSFRVSSLAGSRRRRFEADGQPDDLAHAIALGREAIAAAGGTSRLAGLRDGLASTLRVSFEKAGDLSHLDEAIELGRAAIDGSKDDREAWTRFQTNHSICLRHRYLQRGHAADLDDAVSAARGALDHSSPEDGDRIRVSRLTNLAVVLRSRDTRDAGHDVLVPIRRSPASSPPSDDIDEAIAMLREAASLSRDSRTGWRLGYVAAALLTRYSVTQAPADVDEALSFARRAVTVAEANGTPSPVSDLTSPLNNLVYALTVRSSLTRSRQDVDDAIRVGARVLELEPRDSINWAVYANNVGLAHRARFEVVGDRTSAERGIEIWRAIVENPVAMTRERMSAAQRWAEMAETISPSSDLSLDGFTAAIDVFGRMPWRGLDTPSRERFLAHRAGLGSEAVASALSGGKPDLALQMIEAGRGVLWTQLLNGRTQLEELFGPAPGLARRLQEIQLELDPAGPSRP